MQQESSSLSESALLLEEFVRLVESRAEGRTNDATIQAALDAIVGSASASASLPPPPTPAQDNNIHFEQKKMTDRGEEQQQQQERHREIQPDTENYDDDDDDDDDDDVNKDNKNENKTESYKNIEKETQQRVGVDKTSLPFKRKRGRPRKYPILNDDDESVEDVEGGNTASGSDARASSLFLFEDSPTIHAYYRDIPLGVTGARMLHVFGDGPRPHPSTVAAALHGTRQLLACAIRDARHVRRRYAQLYKTAQSTVRPYRQQSPSSQDKSQWSTELLYRAQMGHDARGNTVPAGFTIQELEILFPETMRAYSKWIEMHEETNQKDDVDAADDVENKTTISTEIDYTLQYKSSADQSNGNDAGMEVAIGHLQQRAEQFDCRTQKMNPKGYLEYASLRAKGSFLPRRKKHAQNNNEPNTFDSDNDPDSTRRNSNSGMSISTKRFWHWVGFDPQSEELPPPDPETTEALAFLAYDFLGRIIEKAIVLRLQQQQSSNSDSVVWELSRGEQLEPIDIERAMKHPDILPVPLFSATSASNTVTTTTGLPKIIPQLYFGPGFEDRLELELEEMMYGTKTASLSAEEMQVRQQEDELFTKFLGEPSFKPKARNGKRPASKK
jgi:hypothetical protein